MVFRWIWLSLTLLAAPVSASGESGLLDDKEAGFLAPLHALNGGTSVPAIAPFAVIGRGTVNTSLGPLAGTALSNVTCGTGSTLVLVIGWIGNPTGTAQLTVFWGAAGPSSAFGGSLTEINSFVDGTNTLRAAIYMLHGTVAGTHDIDITFNDADALSAAATALEVTGGGIKDIDNGSAKATGSGTAPDTGTDESTIVANDVLIGMVVTNGPVADVPGSWGHSFTGVQRDGTSEPAINATTSDSYRIVSSADFYQAGKTGITSRTWIAIFAAIKGQL